MSRKKVGISLGHLFSQVREHFADRLISAEFSYRGTLMSMQHGDDLFRLQRRPTVTRRSRRSLVNGSPRGSRCSPRPGLNSPGSPSTRKKRWSACTGDASGHAGVGLLPAHQRRDRLLEAGRERRQMIEHVIGLRPLDEERLARALGVRITARRDDLHRLE